MNLKKHYEPQALAAWQALVDQRVSAVRSATGLPDTAARQIVLADAGIEGARLAIPVTHVEVLDTGASPEQNFSHRLVEDGISQGWISLAPGTLTVRAVPEHLSYSVMREPGYYCKSTGQRIPITATAWASSRRGVLARAEAQRWLAANGKDAADYEVTNAYECVLNEEQHAKFRKVADAKGRLVGAHRLVEG